MNADGTGRTSLITTNYPGSFDWSPDCKKIAIQTDEGIHVINADGSNLKRLMPIEVTPGVYSGRYYDPAWSPDGRQIAYMEEDEEGIDTLYVMNADGNAETALTDYENGETGSSLSSPTWSPDGEKMAFVSDAGFTGDGGNVVYNSDIYVTGADGSGTMRLTNTPEDEMTPAWAPTARR